jgi:ABC-type Fe3+-hydroxamate transport system substrate-binding protein
MGDVQVRDALGRIVSTSAPPRRIVSLVPSETESVIELIGPERLVGRTKYCVEPLEAVASIPTVGGTKDIDVDAVLALDPDLVLANREENARKPVEMLIAAGLNVHVSFPCNVVEAVRYLRTLALLLRTAPDAEPIVAVERAFKWGQTAILGRNVEKFGAPPPGARSPTNARVFVPIWKDPWMTFDGRTFSSDLLALIGAHNVFSSRKRRNPLAAERDDGRALNAEATGKHDTHYPRVTLEEVRELAPEIALLPDEPYPFAEADCAALMSARTVRQAALIDGKNLFWYGTRLARAIPALYAALYTLRARTP